MIVIVFEEAGAAELGALEARDVPPDLISRHQ